MNDNQQVGAEALAAAMRSAAVELQPPTPQLVNGGLARGRRMRTARRAQMLVASVAVVAAGVGGAVVLPGLGDESTTGQAPVGSAPTAQGSPSSPPLTQEQREQLILDKVMSLLPAGAQPTGTPTVRIQAEPDTTGLRIGHSVDMVLQGASGPGDVQVSITHRRPTEDNICPDMTGITGATCVNETLQDGSTLRLERNREYPATGTDADGKSVNGSGAHEWRAHLITPTGLSIFVVADNAVGEKTRDTAPQPVLTLDQLKSIATDPGWASTVAQAEAGMTANTPRKGTNPKEGAADPAS